MNYLKTKKTRSITWNFSGTLYASRAKSGFLVDSQCWTGEGDTGYYKIDGFNETGGEIILRFAPLYYVKFRVYAQCEAKTYDLIDCEHLFNNTGPVNDLAKLVWEWEYGVLGSFRLDSGIIEQSLPSFLDVYHRDQNGIYTLGTLEFTESKTFNVSLTFDFETVLTLHDIPGNPPAQYCNFDCEEIWCSHFLDRNPDWLRPIEGIFSDLLDTSTTNPKLTITFGGDTVVDNVVLSENDFNIDFEAWKTHWTNTSGLSGSITLQRITPDNASYNPSLIGSISISRSGQSSPSYPTITYSGGGGNDTVNLSGNSISLSVDKYDADDNTAVILYDMHGPYTVSYNNNVKYMDDTDCVVSPKIRTTEVDRTWNSSLRMWQSSDYLEFNSDTFTKTYNGYWEINFYPFSHTGDFLKNNGFTSSYEDSSYGPLPEYFDYPCIGWYRSEGPLSIINLTELGEPNIEDNPPFSGNGYWDKRVLLKLNESYFLWDALHIDLPLQSKNILNFDSIFGWTAVNCDISLSGDSIQITNIQDDAYIEKTYDVSDRIDFQGARFADINFTSDSSNPIDFYISGRLWKITPASKEIDFLSPENKSGADYTSTVMPYLKCGIPENERAESDIPWGWGVYRPNKIRIENLEVGKTYTFSNITIKRKLPDNDGKLRVIIFPQASWAHSRAQDTIILPEAGTNNLGQEHHYQRIGFIVVDGVISGEIISMVHTKTPIYCGIDWSNSPFSIYDDQKCMPIPTNDFLVVEDISPDTVDYVKHGSKALAFLEPGIYEHYSELNIPARIKVDRMRIPISMSESYLDIEKFFRSRVLIRLVTTDKQYIERNIRTYNELSPPHDKDEIIQTDKLGIAITSAFPQDGNCNISIPDAPSINASVTLRNRFFSVVTIRGTIESASGESIATCNLVNKSIYRAYKKTNNIFVGRTFNGGSAWTENQVTTTGDVSNPAVEYEIYRNNARLIVFYVRNGNIKYKYSDNECNTFSPEVDVVQGNYPSVVVDKVTGMLFLFYYRDGKIYCRRSLTFGQTWIENEFIAIDTTDSPANSAFSSEVCEIDKTVIICFSNTSGEIKVAKSNTNGLAPYTILAN